MYEIRYNGISIEVDTIEEVIQRTVQLHDEFKKVKPQMLAIISKTISVEFGIGHRQDGMVILFDPNNIAEDVLLCYNGEPWQGNIMFERLDFIPFECNENNLIPKKDALEELKYILLNSTISNNLKWYSF